MLLTTDVAADSQPAFLADPQDPDHVIPTDLAETFGVDPENVRYQGVWHGEDVYLYSMSGTVGMIGVDRADPSLSHAGQGAGNSPVAWEAGDTTDEKWILQYLPQGTGDLPDGWTAFSPHLAASER